MKENYAFQHPKSKHQKLQRHIWKIIFLNMAFFLSSINHFTYSQCPTFPSCDERTTIIDIDNNDPNYEFYVPVCGQGEASFDFDITNNICDMTTEVCGQSGTAELNCHKIIFRRSNTTDELTFMARIGQGSGCNGELDATFVIDQAGCQRLTCGGSQNVDTYTFMPGENEIIVYGCLNSSAHISICGLCKIISCDFEVTCPTDNDLGSYNCNTLDQIPACPTLMNINGNLVVDNAAGDYGIDVGDMPCGQIELLCSDDVQPNLCGTVNQTITRTITIFDDLDDDQQLDANEEFQVCEFTITIEVDNTPPTNTFCPPGGDLGCNPTPSLYAPSMATWNDNCGIKSNGVRPGTPTSINGCNYSVVHEYFAIDNCDKETTCQQTFTWQEVTEPVFDNCPAQP
ncbi:MAG: hypothetical protein KDC53_22565, partial [Saprospiraceae bacterium]|nr:hypothetical protein [Saprospiraceae bacterium]